MPEFDLQKSYSSYTKQKGKKSIAEAKPDKPSIWNREIEISSAFSAKEKQYFFQMLGVLLDSGLSILESLEILIEQVKKKKSREIIAKIVRQLNEGQSLSAALQNQKKYFSNFEIYSVKMGESSGKLMLVLHDLAVYHEKRIKLQRKFVQAFTYPIVVIFIAVGVLYFMINFVVPMFEDIFSRFNAELPGLTKSILALSKSSRKYGPYFLIAVAVLILIAYQSRNTIWFRRLSGEFLLKLPLVGKIVHKIQLSRFCYTLSLMLKSKVNLNEALELLEKIVVFEPLQRTITPIKKEVVEGKSLYEAFKKHKIFPVMMHQMVRVGERTARLDGMLENLGKNLEEEGELGITRLTNLLEPVLIIILGAIVGTILVSMYLPMFELSNAIGS